MREHVRLHLVPILAVVLTGLAGTLTALAFLYSTAHDEEVSHLRMIVQSQAALIDAVARFDAVQSPDYQGGSRAATITQIVDAQKTYPGFGATGSFVVAERKGDTIVFLAVQKRDEFEVPDAVPWTSDRAQPARRLVTLVNQ